MSRRMLMMLAVALAGACAALATPWGLTCEYRENPVGLDCATPRLSWKLPERVVAQRAYELELDGRPQGRVESDGTLNRPWTGGALETGSRHGWRVRIWDERGEPSGWSAPATFTMGVMRATDWRAQWIGPNPATRPDVDFGAAQWVTSPSGTVRAVFSLAAIPSAKEMVFLSRTPYDLYVNGKKSRGSYEGHIWDGRFAKFHDLAEDELTVGANVLEFRASRKGDPLAVIAVFREAGRTVGSPDWTGVQTLGGLHDAAWATNLVLREELAAPAFRKAFDVPKDVRRATLFVTGLGFYEASLNGVKIGDKVLDPSPTDYTKRVLYSTYLLDGQLRKGRNVLDVLVGHGFYDVRLKSVWDNDMARWRDVPCLLAQLEIEYADGTRETVATDAFWRQVKSPVGFDDIREGEVLGGGHVREPAFPEGGFPVAAVAGPAGRLVAEGHPPTKVLYENRPLRVKPVAGEAGAYMAAFPENVAGWVRLKVRGLSAGDVVSIRYDEHKDGDLEPAVPDSYYRRQGINTLSQSGKVDGPVPRRVDCHFKTTASLNFCDRDRAFQCDRLISSGKGEETFEPRFTYNGFQYVLLRGLKRPLEDGDIVQCVVSTGFPSVGAFDSSDPLLNRLMRAAARTYRANFTVGIPTDCPHREKNGWTGDASVASDFAQFQFENTSAYEKWLRDIVDAQDAKGDLPGIVPSPGWGYAWGNGPAWDSALSVVAWNLYRYRDDRRAVEIAYPALVRYLAYTETRADAAGLVRHGLGDWIPPNWKHIPSVAFTSSCFFRQANEIAAKMADVLGRPDEARRYADRAATLRAAIRARFMKPDGTFDNGGQTAQSAALTFGLVDPGERTAVGARLIEAVHRRDDHLETGVIGCKTLFRALSQVGRTDLALKLILRPDAPSYGAWFKEGGETFWEDWGAGASRNHIMFGDVAAWVYEYVLGVRLDEGANAFRRFVVSPAWTCGLSHASGNVETPFGKLSVSWRRGVGLDVTVPPGTSCRAVDEAGREVVLPPGRHRIAALGSSSRQLARPVAPGVAPVATRQST